MYFREQLGELTPERKEELEKDFWVCRAKEYVAMDALTNGGALSKTTQELLMMLEQDDKAKVSQEMQDPNKLIQWYRNRPSHDVPKELPKIPYEEIESKVKLIEGE